MAQAKEFEPQPQGLLGARRQGEAAQERLSTGSARIRLGHE